MDNYREIRSENYIGYVLEKDAKMYGAAYHIVKKGQYPNFIKGYFLKQNGRDKIHYNTSDLKPILHMLNVIDGNLLVKLLGKAILFMYWVKYSSFVRLDSVILEPMEIYVDSNFDNLKFICLPISFGTSESDSVAHERQFVYTISYILCYANSFENRSCELLYADCQSGYYLLDDLYRDLCSGRYGDIDVTNIDDMENYKNRLRLCVLKATDFYHKDIVVNKQSYIIGKKKEIVDYCIDEDGASRQHCKITVNETGVFLEDLNSTNGTMVNGIRIFPEQYIPLRVGDCITVAAVTFMVQ